jgi:hypothetical protein
MLAPVENAARETRASVGCAGLGTVVMPQGANITRRSD